MRTLLTLIFLLAFFPALNAQIELNGPPVVTGVACNHSELGSIHVRVHPKHPPYTFKWSNGETTERITNLEAGEYTVSIKDANGADTTLQFHITEQECQLMAEPFFTPNGDGFYDYWYISYTHYFPNALILVYNRLGQLVFQVSGEYNDSNRWNGTDLLGAPLPVSTYYYVIYHDKSNKKNVKKGTVSIVR